MILWIKDNKIVVTGEKQFYGHLGMKNRGYTQVGRVQGNFACIYAEEGMEQSIMVLENYVQVDAFLKDKPKTLEAKIHDLENTIARMQKGK